MQSAPKYHCKLLRSPSLRKRLLVHSVSARSAGCNLLKLFARASSWADRQIFSRDSRTRVGIAFAQSQMICRSPALAEAKQAGLLEPKLTGRTSKVAMEHSAEAIRLQAWKRCQFEGCGQAQCLTAKHDQRVRSMRASFALSYPSQAAAWNASRVAASPWSSSIFNATAWSTTVGLHCAFQAATACLVITLSKVTSCLQITSCLHIRDNSASRPAAKCGCCSHFYPGKWLPARLYCCM